MSNRRTQSAAAAPEVVPAASRHPEERARASSPLLARRDSATEEQLQGLMRRYQGGDVRAFEELYGLTHGALESYLALALGGREGPADVLQETYLQLHRSRATYDPALPFRPWMFAVARHVVLTRSRQRRRREPQTVTLELVPELAVPFDLDGLVRSDLLVRALAALAPDLREPVVLHHLYGLSFQQVASVIGISEGAARIRSSRGVSALRQRLAREESRE